MHQLHAEEIINLIGQTDELYYKLILVVAPSGWGKTAVLQEVSRRTGVRYINVNLELSRRLLGLTSKQRSRQIQRVLEDVISNDDEEAVLLDNFELLFDPTLDQNVLRCLQLLSRNRSIVGAWNGIVENGYLVYATPEQTREYCRYPIDSGMLIIGPYSSISQDS